MSATLSSKGQITVPKAVRDALGLKSGDAIDFVIKDGQAILRPRKVWTIDDLAGCLNQYARKKPLSMREERKLLAEAMRPHWEAKFFKGKRA
jgi:AbrB family looped-hinge helix DNA binding protein